MRILVIEDDFVSRTVLSRFLEPFGEVIEAVDGPSGLATYRAANAAGRPFDLVTLDVMMPGLDGFEVLREVRHIEESTAGSASARVLMTTALDDLGNVKTAYEAMCDDYLTKPIRKATLYEKLQKLGIVSPKAPK